MAVQKQAVVGAGLGIGLAGIGAALGVLVHILIGKNGLHIGHLGRNSGVNAFDDGVGMGRTQNLDDKAVLGSQIIGINGLAGYQLHGVLFA